jgi:phosphate starvation-inducible membrane PsiE
MRNFDLLTLTIVYIPLIKGFFESRNILTSKEIRGYAYAKFITAFFIYLGFESLKTLQAILANNLLALIAMVSIVAISYAISEKFYSTRHQTTENVEGKKHNLMSRFYSDMLYGILLALPGTLWFWIENYSAFF